MSLLIFQRWLMIVRYQLNLYHKMHCPEDLDSQPMYQRWLYQRNVEASNACGVAPDAENIQFGDISLDKISLNGEVQTEGDSSLRSAYRCRRCRTPLATSHYIIPHQPRALQATKQIIQPAKLISIGTLFDYGWLREVRPPLP